MSDPASPPDRSRKGATDCTQRGNEFPREQSETPSGHAVNCQWHCEQVPDECTCGLIKKACPTYRAAFPETVAHTPMVQDCRCSECSELRCASFSTPIK
jgi:hypothetical protein